MTLLHGRQRLQQGCFILRPLILSKRRPYFLQRFIFHFFELADQPIEVTMALSETDTERLFQRLREEKINVFYVKAPIEFGMTENS